MKPIKQPKQKNRTQPKRRKKNRATNSNTSKNQQVQRIPRPLGLTLLAQNLNHQSQQKQEIDQQSIQQLIQYTLSNTIQVNNKTITIQTLAYYLNTSTTNIMRAYISYQDKMSKVMLGNSEQVVGALTFLGLNKTLENEALVHDQLMILKASQGGSYKAYISSSVNEALSLKMRSTEAILGLLKTLKPTGPSVVQNLTQNNNNLTQNTAIKAIGLSEALQILNEKGLTKLEQNPEANQHLIPLHNLNNMPEVRATHMSASNTDGISLVPKSQEDSYNPNPTPSSHHTNRRAIEEDVDEEDFNV